MATDSARVQLELASGQSEITAPFYQTAQRRRNQQLEWDPASEEGAPAPAPTIVEVPTAPAPSVDAEVNHEQRGGRTPWIAFAIAIVAVAVAMWWVMARRIPDIDPRDVIARNLNDAHSAMAEGRYTDPPQRSAFLYYSTVLALDPANHDAIAGIDAIADRHLTNARLMLAQDRIAEAGVALEKARRVRPDHEGLAALDSQWRAELKRMVAAAPATPNTEALEKPVPTKTDESAASRPALAAVSKLQPPAPTAEVKAKPAPLPETAEVAAVEATLAVNEPSTSLQTLAPLPEPHPAPVAAEAIPVAEPVAEPKLIRMVQPQYPQEALMRGIEGWVDISLQVSAAGDVVAPRVEDTSRGRMFNQAALAAIEQWKYEPRSDSATGERIRVRVKFQRSN